MPELIMRSEDRIIDGGGGSDSPTNTNTTTNNVVVRWEKFLPKMTLRVLLVEADDSTRHIIAALLRKCSYKGEFLICLLRFDTKIESFVVVLIIENIDGYL